MEKRLGGEVFHKRFFGNGGIWTCQEGKCVKLSMLSTGGCGKLGDRPVNRGGKQEEKTSKER